MKKGDIVKLHTGRHDDWVPALVTGDPGDGGKFFVTAFPGEAKDDEQLQEAACALQAGPGTGRYEVAPL